MPDTPPQIIHLSTLHARDELRVHLKEVRTLRDAGYRVAQVVADGKGDGAVDGVPVFDVGTAPNRLRRMLVLPLRAYRRIRALNPAIVHFHDPELLPVAYMLKRRGHRVIYDAHEDLPRAVLSKTWIRPWLRRLVAWAVEHVEDFVSARIDAVVSATPHIAERFARVAKVSVPVVNYPLESELQLAPEGLREPATFCYAGAVTRHRSAVEMVRATSLSGSRLLLAGPVEKGLLPVLEAMPEWKSVEFLGQVSRDEVQHMMARSVAGLLFYYPEPNHVNALPNKLFEFMSAGLPVLCSDFPFWQSMVEKEAVGYSCSPFDAEAIAVLMRKINADPEAAVRMGLKGHQLVIDRYSWRPEGERLVALYTRLIGPPAR